MLQLITSPTSLVSFMYQQSPEFLMATGVIIGAVTALAFTAALSSPDASPRRAQATYRDSAAPFTRIGTRKASESKWGRGE